MIITFASSKGGVGKSTSCACIAGALAVRGSTVHIVDLDSNRTISRWLANGSTAIKVSTPDPSALTETLEALGKGHDRITYLSTWQEPMSARSRLPWPVPI